MCRISWGMSGHASTLTTTPNIHGAKVVLCIRWDHLAVVHYELLKSSKIITGNRYRTQLMRLSPKLEEKRPPNQETHEKLIHQHGNALPHVARPLKKYLETLKWEVLPHPLYSPDVSPSEYHLFQSMATVWLISISTVMKKSKSGSIRGSPQKTHCFHELYCFYKMQERFQWARN